jgi:hypothetical protein
LDEIPGFHANAVITALNLFWYSLMIKILIRFVLCKLALIHVVDNCHRAVKTAQAEDDRSDDEGEDHDESSKEKED